MPTFIVLMSGDQAAWDRIPPAEQEVIVRKYFAWADELKAKDQLRGGERLGGPGHLLRMVGGRVVDGPFTETKEILTGFFLIEAATLAEAAAIARSCPALTHGDRVVVRPVMHA